MVTSLYAASASAGLMCEYGGNGMSACEAITSNSQNLNTYAWSTAGNVSLSSSSGPFVTAICTSSNLITPCIVNVTVTYPNGSTSNWSQNLPASFSGGSGSVGAGGGNPGTCLGSNINLHDCYYGN